MTTESKPAGPAVTGTGRALIPPHPWSLTVTESAAYDRLFRTRWADAEEFGAALNAYREAVLAAVPVPPPADRAAVLREAADHIETLMDQAYERARSEDELGYGNGLENAMQELRRMAAEAQPASTAPLASGLPLVKGKCPACGTAGLFLGDGGYVTCSLIGCPEPDAASTVLERRPAEAQPTTKPEPDEDPARIDRLRPEFTEHSSVEAIDAQLRRSRAQERRWHIRTEWLISLRDDRVAQKARGEWPAAGVGQDGAQQ